MPDLVVVVGGSGVVGRAVIEYLHNRGIPVVGISRRPPDLPEAKHIPLDLTDADACKKVAADLVDATHIVYAALFEKPGLIAGWQERDQMQTNLLMLQNILEPMLHHARGLKHLSLLQGTKAYGAHVRPMSIPGKEREPRVRHDNFYWLQEDYVKSVQRDSSWRYTIWRPQIIFGHALAAPMNMLAAIGVYAAFCKFDGKPLSYPGGPNAPAEAIDADLLAKALYFSMDNESCANQIFNITNGDVFEWKNVWPSVVEAFSADAGDEMPMKLCSLYDRESDWQSIRRQHGLQDHTIRQLVGDSFYYADALFATGSDLAPPPALLSTIKLRQAGFNDCIDTEDMLRNWFRRMIEMKLFTG